MSLHASPGSRMVPPVQKCLETDQQTIGIDGGGHIGFRYGRSAEMHLREDRKRVGWAAEKVRRAKGYVMKLVRGKEGGGETTNKQSNRQNVAWQVSGCIQRTEHDGTQIRYDTTQISQRGRTTARQTQNGGVRRNCGGPGWQPKCSQHAAAVRPGQGAEAFHANFKRS